MGERRIIIEETNYLIHKILDKYEKSKVDWKNEQTGKRSIKIQQKEYDEIQKLLDEGRYQGYGDMVGLFSAEVCCTGKECILREAKWLELQGLISIKWLIFGNDIESLNYSLTNIGDFYKIAGREPKFIRINKKSEQLKKYQQTVNSEWIRQYYQERIESAEVGKYKESDELDERLFRCFLAMEKLVAPMYVRVFSSQYLEHSKSFEKEMKPKIFAVAKKYHPFVDEMMEDYQIYQQLFLDTYSQELSLKGNLIICLDGKEIDLSAFTYGIILNSETLRRAEVISGQKIKKIITVENKANFVAMSYEEGTLLLFSHGFFSPLEREFLIRLRDVLDETVVFLHTGDLDYGGIRIFQYIKEKIFPKLQPYQMSVEQYKKYEFNAIDMEVSVLEKMKELKEPLLQELIDLICEKKKGIEQESFLFWGEITD